MRYRGLLVVAVLVLGAGVARGADPKNGKRDMAGDGTPFPAAIEGRQFRQTMPLIGELLGADPRETGMKWLSPEASKQAFDRWNPGTNLRPDFFAINTMGGKMVGIWLTDGRVTKAVVFHGENVSESQTKALEAKLARAGKASGNHTFVIASTSNIPVVARSNGQNTSFEITPAGWYIANHQVSEKVKEAMAKMQVIRGMSTAEADVIVKTLNQIENNEATVHEERDGDGTYWRTWTFQTRILVVAFRNETVVELTDSARN